jgi:hypothetical protein
MCCEEAPAMARISQTTGLWGSRLIAQILVPFETRPEAVQGSELTGPVRPYSAHFGPGLSMDTNYSD